MSTFDENDFLTRASSRVGTVVRGKYKIDSVLGVGGMATVFAVTHQNSHRYALKILHPELASLESVCRRFVREGYAANRVNHDGVVTVFDNDVDEVGAPFLLMELLEGASVNTFLEPPNRHMPFRESLGITVQLLDVLAAAHKRGTIHRDIKPSNLFITRDGIVKVLDFGIAKVHESAYELTETRTGTTLGTPSFMAPEQALAKAGEIDARTDIWAVGATMFNMLSGKFVHEGDNPTNIRVIAATESARSLASVAPDVPSQIVSIVDKALSFEKASRYNSAESMRDAVADVLNTFYGAVSTPTLASFVELLGERRGDEIKATSLTVPPKPTEVEVSRKENLNRRHPPNNSAQPFGETTGEMQRRPQASRNRYWIPVLLAVLGILGGTGILTWFMQRPSPGRLTVLSTTDMLVPNDINWIGWTLENSDGSLLEHGEVSLSDWKQLPARLFDISTSDTTGPIRIDIEARRKGEKERIVLDRELLIQMPKAGDKTLVIPLDLLCSEDASPTRCKAGQQCLAGECVDIAFSETLPTAVPTAAKTPPPPSCFNAAQCFASAMQITVPVEDPIIGPCVIKRSPALFNGEKQNLGLVVNRSVVGNFGVCGPSGQCIVPLDYGGPRGWQIVKKDGTVIGIRLPESVCRGIGLNRLFGVAIAPATPRCPAKSSETPLCPDADTCVIKDDICPRTLPSAWIGYDCAGDASPQMIRPDLLSCFLPPRETNGTAVDETPSGKWCCSAGEPQSDNPLVIDDMSGGPQIKIKYTDGHVGGTWWTASDAVKGEFSPPLTPRLFTYRTVSPPVVTADKRSFNRAACFKSSGFNGWFAQMGFGFKLERGSVIASPIDLGRYTGMRFWGYSPRGKQKIAVRFSDRNTFTEDPRSTCNRNPKAGRCGDDFGVQSLVLTPEWKEYVIKWKDFTQAPHDWGQARFESFDQSRVYHAYFAVPGRGPDQESPPFELCVSQLNFTR